MTITTCTDARKLLMPYLDSELDATTTLGLSEHLSSCATCRTRLEAEQSIESGVGQALRAETTPTDVSERVDALLSGLLSSDEGATDTSTAASSAASAELRPGSSVHDSSPPARRSRPLMMRLSGWAAAALVLMSVGFWLRDSGTLSGAPTSPLGSVFVSAYDDYVAVPPRAADLGQDGLSGVLANPDYAGLSLPQGRFAGPSDHRHPIRYLGSRPVLVEGVEALNLAYGCCGEITSVLVLPSKELSDGLSGQLPPGATLELDHGGLKTRAVHNGDYIIGVSSKHSLVLADEISS